MFQTDKNLLVEETLKSFLEFNTGENIPKIFGTNFKDSGSLKAYWHTNKQATGTFKSFVDKLGGVSFSTIENFVVKGNHNYSEKIVLKIIAICKELKIGYNQSKQDWEPINEDNPIEESQFTELHYLCYYWNEKPPDKNAKNEFKIGVGHLEVYYKTVDNNTIFITEKTKLNLFDTKTNTTVLDCEEIKWIDNNLLIRLQDKSLKYIQSQFSLFVGKSSKIIDWKFLTGTYSTIGRSTGRPLAGILLLEKVDVVPNFNFVKEKEENVPSSIFHYLYKTKIITDTDPISDVTKLRGSDETQKVALLSGIYKSHILRHDKDENKYFVEPLFCKIHSNGHIETIIRGDNNDIRFYVGRLRVVKDLSGSIVCYMDLKLPERVYRFTMYFKNKPIKGKFFYGVYAGIEYQKDYPMAGRIRLEKLNCDFNTNIYELLKSEKCYLYPDETQLLEEDLKSLLISGNNERNYLDIIQRSKGELSIKDFAGVYNIYQASTRSQDTIAEHPLKIEIDGTVTLYNNNGWTFTGYVNYSPKGELSLYFDKRLEVDKDGHSIETELFMHYLFSVSDFRPPSLAYGVSTKFNRAGKPVARAVILSFEGKNSDIFKAESFKNYVLGQLEFRELNSSEKKKGILTNLLGDYNRSIIFGSRPDKVINVEKPEQYKNIHFYSACYWATKHNNSKNENDKYECINHFYQAYINGFNDFSLLNYELDNSLKYVYLDKDTKKKPKSFENLPELSIAEIVEKIKTHNMT